MDFYKRDPDAALAGMAELTLQERGAYNTILDLLYSRDGIVPDDDDLLRRVLGCHRREWIAVKGRLMAKGKIWIEDGYLRAKRVQKVIKEAANVSQTQRKRAEERWKIELKTPSKTEKGQRDQQSADAKEPNAKDRMPLIAIASIKKEETPTPTPSSTLSDVPSDDGQPKEVAKAPPPEPKRAVPKTPAPPPKPRRASPYPAEFDEFWAAYPTDKIMSKKNAYDRWARMNAADRQLAMAAVPAFRAYCEDNPDYRPVHAERFLYQRRYEGFGAEIEAGRAGTVATRRSCLVAYGHSGWWPKNESGNGVWKDSGGVGPPPHDPRTLVTDDDLNAIPAAREMRAEKLAEVARGRVATAGHR